MKKSVLLLKTTSALAAAGAAACLAVPLLLQLSLGFTLHSINKGAVAVIGGADGPTAIFVTVRMKMEVYLLLGAALLAGAAGLWYLVKKRGKKQGKQNPLGR